MRTAKILQAVSLTLTLVSALLNYGYAQSSGAAVSNPTCPGTFDGIDYNLNSSTYKIINKFNACWTISSSSGAPNYFIPLKTGTTGTFEEWENFYDHLPSQLTRISCTSPSWTESGWGTCYATIPGNCGTNAGSQTRAVGCESFDCSTGSLDAGSVTSQPLGYCAANEAAFPSGDPIDSTTGFPAASRSCDIACAACSATTLSNCSLDTTSSGSSSGSCAGSYIGTCSYLCSNGAWSQNTNTCLSCPAGSNPSGSGGALPAPNSNCLCNASGTYWSSALNSCAAVACYEKSIGFGPFGGCDNAISYYATLAACTADLGNSDYCNRSPYTTNCHPVFVGTSEAAYCPSTTTPCPGTWNLTNNDPSGCNIPPAENAGLFVTSGGITSHYGEASQADAYAQLNLSTTPGSIGAQASWCGNCTMAACQFVEWQCGSTPTPTPTPPPSLCNCRCQVSDGAPLGPVYNVPSATTAAACGALNPPCPGILSTCTWSGPTPTPTPAEAVSGWCEVGYETELHGTHHGCFADQSQCPNLWDFNGTITTSQPIPFPYPHSVQSWVALSGARLTSFNSHNPGFQECSFPNDPNSAFVGNLQNVDIYY